jgi:D-threo-aldose 1-dehydrogenase
MIPSGTMTDPLQPGRLAVGTAPLGGLYASVSVGDSLATLETAAAGGVTHFDTAPHYGRGLAETRLGAFLARSNDPARFTVSTKVGRWVHPTDRRGADDLFVGAPPGESVFDFSPPAVRAQLEASRARIGRDHIDVALVHDPDDHLDDALAAIEELAGQQRAGRIGSVGVGTNSARVVHHLLDRIHLDVVLLAGRITLLESSGEGVAARCVTDGVALYAAGVFQSGILAGGQLLTCDYAPASPETLERVAELRRVCERFGVALHTAALNHPRRFAGVRTTLVGVRSPAEVSAALDAITVELPDELWRQIDVLRASPRCTEGKAP